MTEFGQNRVNDFLQGIKGPSTGIAPHFTEALAVGLGGGCDFRTGVPPW